MGSTNAAPSASPPSPTSLKALLRSPAGMALLAVWAANLVLALLYGGPLQNRTISDSWHYFAEGLHLAGYGGVGGPVTPDGVLFKNEPLFLPLFLGSLYGGLCSNLGYATWLWGILSMTALMAGAYLLGKYAFSPRTGWLAALAVGLNWQLIGFANLLVDDVAMVAFLVLGAGLYYRSRALDRPRDLLWSGLAFGLSFATKTPFLYLVAPLGVGLLLQNRRNLRALGLLAAGFLAVAVPFLALAQAAFGNPLYPQIARINQLFGTNLLSIHSTAEGAAWQVRHVGLVDTFHLLAVPLALGLLLAPFLLLGLLRCLREKRWLLPFWALACWAFYLFLVRTYIWPDRYMVHYTPLLLVLCAAGLDDFLGWKRLRSAGRAVAPALAAAVLLSANLAPAIGLGAQLWESQGPTVSTLDESKVATVLSSVRPLFLFPQQRLPDDKFGDFALYREGRMPLERVHADSRDWIPVVLSASAPCAPNPAWLGVTALLLAAPFLFLAERWLPGRRRPSSRPPPSR